MGKAAPVLIIALMTIISVISASAYIDPGTIATVGGGTIWPLIIGIVSAIGAFFGKHLIKPIKKLWQKIRGKK